MLCARHTKLKLKCISLVLRSTAESTQYLIYLVPVYRYCAVYGVARLPGCLLPGAFLCTYVYESTENLQYIQYCTRRV